MINQMELLEDNSTEDKSYLDRLIKRSVYDLNERGHFNGSTRLIARNLKNDEISVYSETSSSDLPFGLGKIFDSLGFREISEQSSMDRKIMALADKNHVRDRDEFLDRVQTEMTNHRARCNRGTDRVRWKAYGKLLPIVQKIDRRGGS